MQEACSSTWIATEMISYGRQERHVTQWISVFFDFTEHQLLFSLSMRMETANGRAQTDRVYAFNYQLYKFYIVQLDHALFNWTY